MIYLNDTAQDSGACGTIGFTESLERTPAYPTGDWAITIWSAADVKTNIQDTVGAYPAWRSQAYYDNKAVDDFKNGTGSIQSTLSGHGGWKSMPGSGSDGRLTLPENPHDDDDGDGYTNLEEWIHNYTNIVEGTSEDIVKTIEGLNLQ